MPWMCVCTTSLRVRIPGGCELPVVGTASFYHGIWFLKSNQLARSFFQFCQGGKSGMRLKYLMDLGTESIHFLISLKTHSCQFWVTWQACVDRWYLLGYCTTDSDCRTSSWVASDHLPSSLVVLKNKFNIAHSGVKKELDKRAYKQDITHYFSREILSFGVSHLKTKCSLSQVQCT